jgi:hypothetical protein
MVSYIGRRKFLATLGGAAVAWRLAATFSRKSRKHPPAAGQFFLCDERNDLI